jgi:pimeloyl-ACP methyl ester carboxylesterase
VRLIARSLVAFSVFATLVSGCTDDPVESRTQSSPRQTTTSAGSPSTAEAGFDGLVAVDPQGRRIYVRCKGSGSPTVVLEGGDEDTSESYAFAENALAEETRTCVYDRANLGRSDPDPRRRGLSELVGDLEAGLREAKIPGPYILVGTSGGGYVVTGYAVAHPRQVAGMVFVEVPSPFRDPPAPILEATRWDSPANVENRDYLQVEKDAWASRRRIGDIPVTMISNEYSDAEVAAAEFPAEARGMRTNVKDQRGWLVLSPRAEQVVVHTGHAVEEADPDLVTSEIMKVIAAARAQ